MFLLGVFYLREYCNLHIRRREFGGDMMIFIIFLTALSWKEPQTMQHTGGNQGFRFFFSFFFFVPQQALIYRIYQREKFLHRRSQIIHSGFCSEHGCSCKPEFEHVPAYWICLEMNRAVCLSRRLALPCCWNRGVGFSSEQHGLSVQASWNPILC